MVASQSVPAVDVLRAYRLGPFRHHQRLARRGHRWNRIDARRVTGVDAADGAAIREFHRWQGEFQADGAGHRIPYLLDAVRVHRVDDEGHRSPCGLLDLIPASFNPILGGLEGLADGIDGIGDRNLHVVVEPRADRAEDAGYPVFGRLENRLESARNALEEAGDGTGNAGKPVTYHLPLGLHPLASGVKETADSGRNTREETSD